MIYQGMYNSLLQGVSQQTPQERSDGQLGSQVNMLSDAVAGLRRRGGFKLASRLEGLTGYMTNIIQLNNTYYIVCIHTDGSIRVFDYATGSVLLDTQQSYLVGVDHSTLRYTISGDRCYMLNTKKVPQRKDIDPDRVYVDDNTYDWMYVTKEGLAKERPVTVNVTFKYTGGSETYSVLYGAGDETTPNEIARAIHDLLKPQLEAAGTGIEIFRSNSSVVFRRGTDRRINLSWTMSSSLNNKPTIISRNNGTTRRSDLPLSLPSEFDNYIGTTGSVKYYWDKDINSWNSTDKIGDDLDPTNRAWVQIVSGNLAKQYSIVVTRFNSPVISTSMTTSSSDASQASTTYVAGTLTNQLNANTDFSTLYVATQYDNFIVIESKVATQYQITVESGTGVNFVIASGAARLNDRNQLPATLPSALDGYVMAIGALGNSAYYSFQSTTKTWREVGKFEKRYEFVDMPLYWYVDSETEKPVIENLKVQGRLAGDDDNNPLPAFVDYGITGISAYQSRLVLLSGSYVCFSRSKDPTTFTRTTVTEVLDDDPIEISSTALSNTQFEYAIAYNKDLVLIAQDQQAVIPSNNTVLTPKTAVIYPSTETDLSLACEPKVVGRSVYYTYQRGSSYYQLGELIPNSYTDAQYYSQGIMEHLPLYTTGVAQGIASSTISNAAVVYNGSTDVLVNQFLWAGDQRALMSFHKWVLPNSITYSTFINEFCIVIADTGSDLLVLTTNMQLNQLDDKPIPFLDCYQYVEIDADGYGVKPDYIPEGDLVAVIYDHATARHTEVQFSIDSDGRIVCPYHGTIALGIRYTSEFTLTPPFLKDQNGKVINTAKSTVNSFNMTFKGTGAFQYSTSDARGSVYLGDSSALTWSEANLMYTWVNSIGTVKIPCRTLISSTNAVFKTDSCTDLNVISAEYLIRVHSKYRRL